MRRGSCAYFGGARSWSATGLIKSQGTLTYSKVDKFLKRTFETGNNEHENVPNTSKVVKKQRLSKNSTGKSTFIIGFHGVVTKIL